MKNFIIFLTIVVIVHYFFFLFGFSFGNGTNTNFYIDNNLTLEEKGVFGDFTSGHFSILAFIWLAYGIYIQSKEFQLQREEFQNQTEQFKEQNKLYEQQMKELEIQSIQNQFDRKIAKLTEIEKNIANSKLANYDVYNFIMESRSGLGDFDKIDKVQKYIILYNNLKQFILANKHKIDLEDELTILKQDIYSGLKLSFIMLLWRLQHTSQQGSEVPYYKRKYKHLKITQFLQENISAQEHYLSIVNKITNNFQNLDDIDIFEEIEPS